MQGRSWLFDGPTVFMFVVVTVAVLAFSVAQAAGLNVSSGGVALKNRPYDSPVTCTLTSSVADTYVRADMPGMSFGSQIALQVSSSAVTTRRTLVRFDLSECSPSIPTDAIVHSATVTLTTEVLDTVSTRTYELRRATSSWTESTTWSTQPTVAGSATSTTIIPAFTPIGTSVQWAAERDVQAFIAGDHTNLGWRLKDLTEGSGPLPPAVDFISREAAIDRPRLVITYAP